VTWLVTGGAGYVGGHVVEALQAAGHDVVVLDDLSTGERHRAGTAPLVEGSVLDCDLLRSTVRAHGVSGIVHVAAKKAVGESVERPLYYYEQNVEGLRRVLDVASETGVSSLLFSSSAAVYGTPDVEWVTEETRCDPESPYGHTKLVGEWMVRAVARVTGLRYANLRYFNVAGAGSPELVDNGVFNLVPMVFERLSKGEAPRIFGGDYDTPDGTCVRDFIHVADVASAHAAAATRLAAGTLEGVTLNIGRGEGVSVRQMIDTIAEVTGIDVPPVVESRRPGDPSRVVASARRINEVLDWSARRDVVDMVSSAWQGWQRPPL